MMKKENVLASYLISLGEEVFHLLLAKGAKKEDAEDIIRQHDTMLLQCCTSLSMCLFSSSAST